MTVMESQQPAAPRGLLDDWLATLNVETGLYILIGLLALAVRLNVLGDAPLSAPEAREALSAWRLVSNSSLPSLPPTSAAYYSLTALTFFLLGANEFLARFWPVVAGAALVFTPLLFRRDLGRATALVASALLAVSPTLMATSRTADGATLAALGLVLALAGLRQLVHEPLGRGWLLGGLGLGLALASGPHVVTGLAAGLFAIIVVVFIQPSTVRALRASWNEVRPRAGRLLVVAGLGFVAVASAGLLIPSGLSAAGAALPNWLAAWMPGAGTRPVWLVPQIIAVNEPLLTVMGIVGFYLAFLSGFIATVAARLRLIFSAQTEQELEAEVGRNVPPAAPWLGSAAVLSATALGALLFTLVYPGRTPTDSIWVTIPLALLTAKVIVETFAGDWFEGEFQTVLAQAAVLFVMLVFAYFNFAAYGRGSALLLDRPLEWRLYLAAAVLALGIFVTIMFGLGWSTLSAVRGAVLAVGAALLIGMLSSGFGLTVWRPNDPNELWFTNPTSPNIALLRQSIRDTSQRFTGKVEQLEIAVVNDPVLDDRNSVLGWELRGYPNAKFVDSLDMAVGSAAIIADSAITDPRLNTGYTGERFGELARQVESDPTASALVNWWLYRNWPTDYSRYVTFWVRGDVHNLLKQP